MYTVVTFRANAETLRPYMVSASLKIRDWAIIVRRRGSQQRRVSSDPPLGYLKIMTTSPPPPFWLTLECSLLMLSCNVFRRLHLDHQLKTKQGDKANHFRKVRLRIFWTLLWITGLKLWVNSISALLMTSTNINLTMRTTSLSFPLLSC